MNSSQTNNILAALPGSEFEKFANKLREVPLKSGHVVFLKRSLRSLAVGNFPWKFPVTS